MQSDVITYEVADRVATITLNRPDKLNTLAAGMLDALSGALDAAERDDDVRCVILTGAGRAFCAGADLSGYSTDSATSTEESAASLERDGGGVLALRIFDFKKPTIAAINGAAVGIGATMTLPFDIRMAAEQARFGFVFNRRGLVADSAASWFLPKLVGIQTGLEWCYTGRFVNADEAKERGLVRSIHTAEDLIPAARALAREIAESTSPVANALTRQMMWRMLGADHPMAAHRADSRAAQARGRSSDVREGVQAFLQKRTADWPDRVAHDLPDIWGAWTDPEFF
jgi:enoyl-CoA hydratase/carnithine racemase